jgi:DNA-binding IclR family transcriptional regulator
VVRADGKLFELLADDVCAAILRALIDSESPLTQRQLTAALGYTSSTISRRIGSLEDVGLVQRDGARSPYVLGFPNQTRDFLAAGLTLSELTHDKLAQEAREQLRELRGEQGRRLSTVVDIRGSA